MEITSLALKQIRMLRARQGLPKRAALRLAFKEEHVRLTWDDGAPRPDDLVLTKRGVAVFMDARVYGRLSGYALDFDRDGGSAGRFLLRSTTRLLNGHRAAARPPR